MFGCFCVSLTLLPTTTGIPSAFVRDMDWRLFYATARGFFWLDRVLYLQRRCLLRTAARMVLLAARTCDI